MKRSIMVNEDLHHRLRVACALYKLKLGDFTTYAIGKALDQYEADIKLGQATGGQHAEDTASLA